MSAAGDPAFCFCREDLPGGNSQKGRESAGTKRDSQMSTHVITADGKDYLITVTYESEAEIPQGAELAV